MMKKRAAVILLTGILLLSSACGNGAGSDRKEEVSLCVTTTFAGEDGNAQHYQDGVKSFEEETGIRIQDASQTSDEAFKTKIETDFQSGAEPDVLFYFTGADANPFIKAGKVVPLEEIRKEYPNYASNMNDSKLIPSLVDHRLYTVSTNGYWEAMYVNKKILADCGIEIPDEDYTWEQFMADCRTIREKGYVPVAAARGIFLITGGSFAFSTMRKMLANTRLCLRAQIRRITGWRAWKM